MTAGVAKKVKVITRNDEIFTKDERYPPDQSVMQNRMIEAWNSMSVDEKRIFILASPLVRLCDATEKTMFSISAKDYAEACNIELATAYSQLKLAADNLRGRYFSYINSKGNRVSVHWVIRIEYSEAQISFCFPDEVLFMLSVFDSNNAHTRFKIETALKLKGAHSLQLYQLLKQYEKIGYRELTVERFRQIFELTKKYSIISNLRIRVIEPAVSEISKQTDLKITFSQIFNGKSIIGFRFDIQTKIKKSSEKIKLEQQPTEQPKKIRSIDIYQAISKNNLLDRFKQVNESSEEFINRIRLDLKSNNAEIWIKKLAEFNVYLDEPPF